MKPWLVKLVWLLSTQCILMFSVGAAIKESASQEDLNNQKEIFQLKIDQQKDLLIKDIQAKDKELTVFKDRLDKQDGRISDVGLYLSLIGVLITSVVAGLVFLGFISAKRQVSDQAEKWFDDNAQKLKAQILDLEKQVSEGKNKIDNQVAQVLAHGGEAHTALDEAIANMQETIGKQQEPNPHDISLIEKQANQLKDKPESSYTYEDWNTRAFAAVSDKNLALAIEYWSKAAAATNIDSIQFAQAMYNKGLALSYLNRREESIALHDAVFAQFSNRKEAAVQQIVAAALINKGITLGQLNLNDDELAVYDVLIAKFGESKEAAIQEQVSMAMFNKGITLGQLNLVENQIAVYDALIVKFSNNKEAAIKRQVSMAMVNKGIKLGQLNRSEDEIAVYDELITKFSDSQEAAIQEQVSMAMVNKGVALRRLHRSEDSIVVYDSLIAKFGGSKEAAVQVQLAKAMVNKGFTLGQLKSGVDEIVVYDSLISKFGDSKEAEVQEQVTIAMINKSAALGDLNRVDDAISVYDALIAKFADNKEAAVQEQLAKAMVNKGFRLWQLNRAGDSIAMYDAVISKFDDNKESAVQESVAVAMNGKGYKSLMDAKTDWSDEVGRSKLLLLASNLFSLAFSRDAKSAITIGNQAYAAWLQGMPEIAEEKFKSALTAPVNGGETIYKATLADLEMHPVDLDAGFKVLIERLWLEYSNSKSAD